MISQKPLILATAAGRQRELVIYLLIMATFKYLTFTENSSAVALSNVSAAATVPTTPEATVCGFTWASLVVMAAITFAITLLVLLLCLLGACKYDKVFDSKKDMVIIFSAGNVF